MEGAVSVIFLAHKFTYPDGHSGLEQMFIVLAELAKRLGTSIWWSKIMAWNEKA